MLNLAVTRNPWRLQPFDIELSFPFSHITLNKQYLKNVYKRKRKKITVFYNNHKTTPWEKVIANYLSQV